MSIVKPYSNSSLIRLPIAEVLASAPPRHDFVLPGLPRGSVGALVGPGGTGKTALEFIVAVSQALGISSAGDLFPAPPTPRHVALITGEEGKDECAIRLHAIVDHILSPHLPLWRGGPREELVNQLQQRLNILPCAGVDINLIRQGVRTEILNDLRLLVDDHDLIFIETVSRLHDGDENATASMAALVNAVEWIARSARAAVVLVHHSSKAADLSGRGDSQHAARGSSSFVDNVRWVGNLFGLGEEEAKKIGLEKERKRYLRFEVTKANYIAPQEPRYLQRLDGGVLRALPLCSATARSGGKSRGK